MEYQNIYIKDQLYSNRKDYFEVLIKFLLANYFWTQENVNISQNKCLRKNTWTKFIFVANSFCYQVFNAIFNKTFCLNSFKKYCFVFTITTATKSVI